MNRAEFRNILLSLDLSDRPEEMACRQRMIELLDSCPNCFRRDAFPAHFTGSAFVVSADGARSLLHHHRKLDRWLQFGGQTGMGSSVTTVAPGNGFPGCTSCPVAASRQAAVIVSTIRFI